MQEHIEYRLLYFGILASLEHFHQSYCLIFDWVWGGGGGGRIRTSQSENIPHTII